MPLLSVLRWEAVKVRVFSVANSVVGHVYSQLFGHLFGRTHKLVEIAEADIDDAQTIINAKVCALELFC